MKLQPSPGQSVEAACHGKEQLTRAVAMQVASRGGRKRQAYRCDFCHHWHIGESIIPKGRVKWSKR